ncbi:methyl-accepting chemotaxis protein [Photobacterium sp. MCCC 1A19761]|uniref:methyl-accepting chemotaxis protein n=1 Tax=Photobacterium sp. MCCC 1A19761 TaxID=3115000 RepID=UPI00307E667B
MNYVLQLKVKTRLILGFGTLLCLMLLLTILGIQKVNQIDTALAQMTDINSLKQRYAINFRGSVHDRAIAIRDVAMARNASELAGLEGEIKRLERFYRDSEGNMNQMINRGVVFTPEELSMLRTIDQIQQKTLPLVQAIIADKKQGIDTTVMLLEQARPAFVDWLNAINRFIDFQEGLNQKMTPEARAVASGFEELMLVLTGIAIAISLVVAVVIERSFRRSLGGEPFEAQKAIQLMADGDLTHDYGARPRESILDSLSTMSATLTGIVSNIAGASTQIVEQAEEVSGGAGRVLKSAERQASVTADTLGRLEGMRDTIDQIADVANQTESNSVMTTDNARQGRALVFGVAQQMETIAETVNATVAQVQLLEAKTKDIGGIVNVISGISEQTNLLALNAAIEAARAGESGRGFAVVADEVRQLAQRTGEATSQIESLISEVQSQTAISVKAMQATQPQVAEGNVKTAQASELLMNIEQQAEDTLNRIREVVSATQAQVDVVGEIVSDMGKISDMSSESIRLMNTNEQAGKALNQLSGELKQAVGFFRV